MRYFVLILFAILAGCANVPDQRASEYADCLLPVTETSDQNVQTLGCAYYAFRANRMQDYRFRHHMAPNFWSER